MDRRRFLLTSLAAALTAPLAAGAQQAGQRYRVGYVAPSGGPSPITEGFRRGLVEAGYIEGRNLTLDYRWMRGKESSSREVLRDLSRENEVIVVYGEVLAALAKEEVTNRAVVFINVSEPIARGFVKSLAKPGVNITGLSNMASELTGKRLELLKEINPRMRQPRVSLQFAQSRCRCRAGGSRARRSNTRSTTPPF